MKQILKSISVCLLFVPILSSCFNIKQKIRIGNTLVYKIEEFRSQHDSLPSSILEIGTDGVINGELFCYSKRDSSNYIVWFGTTLGEGVYYYSDTRQWEDQLR